MTRIEGESKFPSSSVLELLTNQCTLRLSGHSTPELSPSVVHATASHTTGKEAMASRCAEFLTAHDRTQNGREAMAFRRAGFIAARDLTPMWAEFEAAKAEWAVEQDAAKAAQRERKSQKALKKREARRCKKEKDTRAAAERSVEIQAWWGVAHKTGKKNDDVWPACEK